jgi:hypothetical protein
MDYDEKSTRNVKFIFYCFEWMSDLKINYHKSEVYPIGLSESEQNEVANMLNCKVCCLPMVYLGSLVFDKHLRINALKGVPEKLQKRLQPWKGKNMTWGEWEIDFN